MYKSKIGENAGIVWRALNNNRLSWEELVRTTNLNSFELAAAIGWLSREDKISITPSDGILYFEIYKESYY